MHWPANRSALHLVGQVSPTPQQQAQSSGQQLGAVVGVGLGVLLGKTLLAGHPHFVGDRCRRSGSALRAVPSVRAVQPALRRWYAGRSVRL